MDVFSLITLAEGFSDEKGSPEGLPVKNVFESFAEDMLCVVRKHQLKLSVGKPKASESF